jgi:hypothetical protein
VIKGVSTEIINAVLTVLGVLPTEGRKLRPKGYLGIPLRELLEGEASMPKDLSGNGAGGVDLHHHMSHLERRPVLMGNEVSNQSLTVRVVLVDGIGYPCTVSNKLFCFRRD